MEKITITVALDGSITYFYHGVKEPRGKNEIVTEVDDVEFFLNHMYDYVYTPENGLVYAPDEVGARIDAKRRCIAAFNAHRTVLLNRYGFDELVDVNPSAIDAAYFELSKYIVDFSTPTPISDTIIGDVKNDTRHASRLVLYRKCKTLIMLFASAQNQKDEMFKLIDRCPDGATLRSMTFIPYEPKTSALRWGY